MYTCFWMFDCMLICTHMDAFPSRHALISQAQNVQYMSQVSYRIPWICHIGFTWNLCGSLQKSVNFHTVACRLPWIFRGIIANYTQKHSWVSAGCRRTFEGDCTAIYARFTQSPVDCGWLSFQWTISHTPEDDFTDSITCGLPKII